VEKPEKRILKAESFSRIFPLEAEREEERQQGGAEKGKEAAARKRSAR